MTCIVVIKKSDLSLKVISHHLHLYKTKAGRIKNSERTISIIGAALLDSLLKQGCDLLNLKIGIQN